MTLLAAIGFGGTDGSTDERRVVNGGGAPSNLGPGAIADPATYIPALQDRLRRVPGDHRGWSTLVLAYVEQARITADPTYYSKADEALARAVALSPEDSVMLTAKAALDNARHDFRSALSSADKALATNRFSAAASAYRADALTELGRYPEALRAAHRADNLEPGPSTFARLSYAAELRGDLEEATRLMRLSRDAASTSAASFAFASYHLGELARIQGDLDGAGRSYAAALEADETFIPAYAGRARIAVARGELAAAERDYTEVVRRLPLPEYLVELGELYLGTDREGLAEQQFSVATATAELAKANGVRVDVETAIFEADHGSPEVALAAARTEWDHRQSVFSADALAWALHVNGRDREALRYAREATRLGTQDARMLFHRGAVEAALDMDEPARRHLRAALAIDGGAAPWRQRLARHLLRAPGGTP
jgi:tetratricopeptide (TPR) repeat protein